MKKPFQLFLFTFFCFSVSLGAQPDTLRLKGTRKIGALGFDGSSAMVQFSNMSTRNPWYSTQKPLKKVPEGWTDYYREGIWFQAHQFAYQNCKAGRMTPERLSGLMESWNFDSTGLSPKEIRCSMEMIFRRTENGGAEYILDTDGDLNFADEKVLRPLADALYDSLALRDSLIATAPKMLFEISTKNGIVSDIVPLMIGLSISKRYGTYLNYYLPDFYLATYKQDSLIVTAGRPDFEDIEVCHKKTINTEHFGISGEQRKEGDLIELGSNWYRVEGFDRGKEELILTSVDTETDTVHPQTGFYAPDFAVRDYSTSEGIMLEQFKGKYLVLDFWATWCTGCVQVLPEFVEFHKKMKDMPVEILSVACTSNETNFAKLREKYGLNWLHAWQAQPVGIIKDYQVSGYPVYFLIGPDGKILSRTLFLSEIENKLLTQLQN